MKDYALLTVTVVALTCMMAAQIFGIYYDAMFRQQRVELVQCGVDIQDMARKLNVTLAGSCEVTR